MELLSLPSRILSVKTVLISVGVLSMAFILNLSLPLVLEFIVNQLPLLWKSWLTPPYLYILINGIILTIAASSRFHHEHSDKISDDQDMEILNTAPVVSSQANKSLPDFSTSSVDDEKETFVISRNYPVTTVPEALYDFVTEKNNPVVLMLEMEPEKTYGQLEKSNLTEMMSIIDSVSTDGAVNSTSTWTLNRGDSMEVPTDYSFKDDKPPISSRFGHRKTSKSSNEGSKGLRSVANRKRNDTLESTWKTITEGRSIPLARHLKKSDTWETHNATSHVSSSLSSSSATPLSSDHQFNQLNKMKKSETFIKDGIGGANTSTATSLRRGNSGKLRKEPSLSEDDLNRRVEAFIKKFNEEMRLQRQESLNQYNELVKLGLVTNKGE